MQLVFADRRSGKIRVVPETLEDLWILERAIDEGDVAEGVVLRRVKREGERGAGRVFRVFVKVIVEGATFHEYSGALRISGVVLEARPEDLVGKGKHQTLEIKKGTELSFVKRQWSDYVLEEIQKAVEESKRPSVTVVSMDDEGALVCTLSQRLQRRGYVKNQHRGKRGGAVDFTEYYGQILRFISDLEPELVVVGSPGFFYEDFIKFAKSRGAEKRFVGVRLSLAGMKGIHEILTNRIGEIVQNHHLSEILRYTQEFTASLAKGEPIALGAEVENYAIGGAVDVLLMHEDFFLKNRDTARRILDAVKDGGGRVFIVPRTFEPAHMLEKMGGVVAILRYR